MEIKDYCCIDAGDGFRSLPGEEYLRKASPILWLYVNVTDRCNASCPFCVSRASKTSLSAVDPARYRKALQIAAPHIYGVTFTGGEPMLYPDLLDELVQITDEIVSNDVEIDLATNGTELQKLSELTNIDRITSVHISRHSYDDTVNSQLMGRKGPDYGAVREFISNLNDPGKAVFNCVLQKGGVECCDDVARYLDMAIKANVQNNSFITMFTTNAYCKENYISARVFPFTSDLKCKEWNNLHTGSSFAVWNRHSDHEYCHCLSGSYINREGSTRFYFRCPGNDASPDYCRQLVYTARNQLQDGFGSNRLVLWK